MVCESIVQLACGASLLIQLGIAAILSLTNDHVAVISHVHDNNIFKVQNRVFVAKYQSS